MKKRFASYTVGVRAMVGDCVQTEYEAYAVVEGTAQVSVQRTDIEETSDSRRVYVVDHARRWDEE